MILNIVILQVVYLQTNTKQFIFQCYYINNTVLLVDLEIRPGRVCLEKTITVFIIYPTGVTTIE